MAASAESDCHDTNSVRHSPMGRVRLRRAANRSLRDLWQLDGACDVVLASHLPQDHVVCSLSVFATRRHAVMDGIRQRIAGLRRRAETAPAWLQCNA